MSADADANTDTAAPPDAGTVFCVAFALLGYKLMFWSERSISLGAVVLCALCAFAVAQLATGGASRVGAQALAALAEPVVGAGRSVLCSVGQTHLPAGVRQMLCGREGEAKSEL